MVNWKHVRLNAEIYGYRLRNAIKLVIRLAIAAAVLLAVYNLFVPYAQIQGLEVWAPYRIGLEPLQVGRRGMTVLYKEDIAVLVVGAILGWNI